MQIRTASLADVDAVVDVHIRSRTEYYRGHISEERIAAAASKLRDMRDGFYAAQIDSPDLDVLCAELDGRVVGFAMSGPCHYPDPDPEVAVELHHLYVDPDHWRRGVASSLHEECVRRWRAPGVGAARLFVWEFNERAVAFYAARGWRADGHFRADAQRIGEHQLAGYRLPVPTA